MMKSVLGAASAMAVLVSAPVAIAHEFKADVKESYDLTGFDQISVAGVYHLDVKVGGAFSVAMSGSKTDMAKIDVYVEDGELVLDMKDGRAGKIRGENNHGVKAVITLPKLEAMEIAGVVTGEVTKIKAKSFEIDFAGVGELKLSGTCTDLELDMAGVGELDAEDLKCEDVSVDLAGMGEASVYASERIDANSVGMGSIEVYGSPDVVQKSSAFMSSVHIR